MVQRFVPAIFDLVIAFLLYALTIAKRESMLCLSILWLDGNYTLQRTNLTLYTHSSYMYAYMSYAMLYRLKLFLLSSSCAYTENIIAFHFVIKCMYCSLVYIVLTQSVYLCWCCNDTVFAELLQYVSETIGARENRSTTIEKSWLKRKKKLSKFSCEIYSQCLS